MHSNRSYERSVFDRRDDVEGRLLDLLVGLLLLAGIVLAGVRLVSAIDSLVCAVDRLGRRIVRKGRSRCCRGPYNASWALVAGSTLATTLFWIILTLGSRISAGPGS
jgi:hypothetical protein